MSLRCYDVVLVANLWAMIGYSLDRKLRLRQPCHGRAYLDTKLGQLGALPHGVTNMLVAGLLQKTDSRW
jgi:hypothetical protein